MLHSSAIGSRLLTACSSVEHASARRQDAQQLAAVVWKYSSMESAKLRSYYYRRMTGLRSDGKTSFLRASRDRVKTPPPPTCSCLNHVTTVDAELQVNWQEPAFLHTTFSLLLLSKHFQKCQAEWTHNSELTTPSRELGSYVPLDAKHVIQRHSSEPISWHSTEETKLNTTKANIHQ